MTKDMKSALGASIFSLVCAVVMVTSENTISKVLSIPFFALPVQMLVLEKKY